jgi:hypothetical protein
MTIKKILGGHEHSGSAKTALNSPMSDKRFLQGVKHVSVRRQTLDGRDVSSVTISSQYETGVYRPAIQDDDAGTTLPCPAPLFGSNQSQSLP